MPDRFLVALGGGVFLVWAASMFAEMITRQAYTTPLAVHGMMGTIVGSVFTEYRMRKKQREREDQDA